MEKQAEKGTKAYLQAGEAEDAQEFLQDMQNIPY